MKDQLSTNELRFEFSKVLKALARGERLKLTYRNRLIAYILPAVEAPQGDGDDPLFSIAEMAEPMGSLINSEIDEAIYGK